MVSEGHLQLASAPPMARALDRSLEVHDVTRALVCERFPAGLRALLLTGSLARGEGTWREHQNRIKLVGDVEHLMVFDDRNALPSEDEVAALRRHIEATLAERGIDLAIGLSPVTPDFLRSLEPTIFAYELIVHGKTLWGDDLRHLAPRFAIADIPLEDGFRTLMNRVIELLEAIGAATQLDPLPETVRHRAVKLCLDMATAFLLFSGHYEPSYRARAMALGAVMKESPVVSLEWGRLLERTVRATAGKLGDTSSEPITSKAELLELSADVQRLWRWSLQRIGHASNHAVSDRQAIVAWCAAQPWSERLRGWAFVARACGPIRSLTALPHWAFAAFRGSPRRLIYSAAGTLFFALPDLLAADSTVLEPSSQDFILRQLPLPTTLTASASWRLVVATIASHYHRFLESTRA